MRAWSFSLLVLVAACGGSTVTIPDASPEGGGGPPDSTVAMDAGADAPANMDAADAAPCPHKCSPSTHEVLDCNDQIVQQCAPTEACDVGTIACVNACAAAKNNKQSIGCDFRPASLEVYPVQLKCYAVIIANTWTAPAKIQIVYNGQQLNVGAFTRIPMGSGMSITYSPYNPNTGIAPGEAAIAFLGGDTGTQGCPVTPPTPGTSAMINGTTIGKSFQLTSDVPVAVYQINPYGFNAFATGSSLLLPTTTWGTNYVVNTGSPQTTQNAPPAFDIVAQENGTQIKLLPKAPVVGGGGIPGGVANQTMTFTINAGDVAQISQIADLAGSIIETNKPVGVWSSQPCMNVPQGVFYCDHGEQMLLPISSLGSEYPAVAHRPRANEPALWRLVGAVDGTTLTYSPAVAGAPATLSKGQVAEFESAAPFVVASQDAQHPFQVFAYMSGGQWMKLSTPGQGDPEHVLITPPEQYLREYVFFTDPTFAEANLVVVRAKNGSAFEDVNLDCAGNLSGWTALGQKYEWTRADLQKGGAPVGSCSSGRRVIKSKGPFGLWAWGWGNHISFGYPGGTNVRAVNNVTVPAQ